MSPPVLVPKRGKAAKRGKKSTLNRCTGSVFRDGASILLATFVGLSVSFVFPDVGSER